MARPARIDRTQILAASLEIADEVGVDALTMQAVAGRIGVSPMALYRHVADKADLLDGVVEQLLGELEGPPAGLGWDDQLRHLAHQIRAVAVRHPTVFPLLLRRPATTPGALRVREAIYAALRAGGVAEDEVARTERLLSTVLLGFAASEAGGRFRAHPRATVDADFDALLNLLAPLFIASA